MTSAMNLTLTQALPTPALNAPALKSAYAPSTTAQQWKDPNRHRNSLT